MPVPGLRALVVTFWPSSGMDFRRGYGKQCLARLESRREAAGPLVRPRALCLVFLLFAPKSDADAGSVAQAEDGGRRRRLLSGEVKEHSLGAKPRCIG